MTWAAFKDKFVENVKYVGSLAASLFTAPYLRELFDMVVDNTVGRPTSPYTYVPYVIAREGFGYLGAPVVIQAATTLAQKGGQVVRNKIKPNTHVVDTTAIPVARIVSLDDIEAHKQKLEAFLAENPEAAEEVGKFTPTAHEKLVNHECFDRVFTALAKMDKEKQKQFFQRFATQHATPEVTAICKANTL